MNKNKKGVTYALLAGVVGVSFLSSALVQANTSVPENQSHLSTSEKNTYFEYALGQNGKAVTLSDLRACEASGQDKFNFIVEHLDAVLYQFEYSATGEFLGYGESEIFFDKESSAYCMLKNGNAGHYELPLVNTKGDSIGEYLPVNVKDTDTLVAGQNYPDVYIYNEENIRIDGQKLKSLSASEVEALLVREGDIKGMDFSGNVYPVALNLRGPQFYDLSHGIPGEYTLQYDLSCVAGYTHKKITFTVY